MFNFNDGYQDENEVVYVATFNPSDDGYLIIVFGALFEGVVLISGSYIYGGRKVLVQ